MKTLEEIKEILKQHKSELEIGLENYLSELFEVIVDLVLKKALKPNIR